MNKLDIIIPCYNGSKTLGRCLSSLVAQLDKNFDVTIVDDCSTDNILPIINEYRDKLNINYIRNETNLGCGMTRQVGIDNTYNDYYYLLDADDMLTPVAVRVFNAACKQKGWGVLFTPFYEEIKDSLVIHDVSDKSVTWVHGKFYCRAEIDKYNIRNTPEVKWADDSCWNVRVFELTKCITYDVPTHIWTNNPESVTNIIDGNKKVKINDDMVKGFYIAVKHVLEYKDKVNCYEGTLKHYDSVLMSDRGREYLNKLKQLKGAN